MGWLEEHAWGRSFPPLPADLARQLASIPSSDGLTRPCRAVLIDGSVLDRVYFAESASWFMNWGVWPDEDPGKCWIDVRSVARVEESGFRLPVRFAEELYRAGESGMGYLLFRVRFRDGSTAAFVTGGAV